MKLVRMKCYALIVVKYGWLMRDRNGIVHYRICTSPPQCKLVYIVSMRVHIPLIFFFEHMMTMAGVQGSVYHQEEGYGKSYETRVECRHHPS